MVEEIKLLIENFFQKINITIDSLNIVTEELNNNEIKTIVYNIKIQTKESGLLIGPHGKNLDSFQNILRLMISKKIKDSEKGEEFKRLKLHLEINDYVKSKDDRLIDFIKTKVEQLNKTNKDICLPYYGSYERKKIHGYISELNNENIYTKSIGEGKDRRLYICGAQKKLTIDIDGDDI